MATAQHPEGVRLREPPELDFSAEEPSMIDSMIRLHRDVLRYNLNDLEMLLHMQAKDIPGFYGFDPDGDRHGGPRLRVVQ